MKFAKGDKVVVDPKSWSHSSWKGYVFTVTEYYKDDNQYAVETPAGLKKLFKAKDLIREDSETPKFKIGDTLRVKQGSIEFDVAAIYSFGTEHYYQGTTIGSYRHEDDVVRSLEATKSAYRVGDYVRVTGGVRVGQIAEVVQDGTTMMSGTYILRFLKDNNRAMYGRGILEKLSDDVAGLAIGDRVVVVSGSSEGTEGVLSEVGASSVTVDHDSFMVTHVYRKNVRRISRFNKGDRVKLTRSFWTGSEWTVTGQHGPDYVAVKSDKGTAIVPIMSLEKVKPLLVSGTLTASSIATGKISISPTVPKTDADSDTLKKIEEQFETANMLKYIEILNKIDEAHGLSAHDKKMRHELAVKVETRLGFPQH